MELRGKRGPFTITEDGLPAIELRQEHQQNADNNGEEAQATEAKGGTEIAGNATGIG